MMKEANLAARPESVKALKKRVKSRYKIG